MSPLRQRVAFLVPPVLVALVLATHLGPRNGCYRMNRAEDLGNPMDSATADGIGELEDGIPLNMDVHYERDLEEMFRGRPGREVTTPVDERPLAPFLHVLLGAGWTTTLWAGSLLNLLFVGAASACAVDLFRRRGLGLGAAFALGSLFALGRGIAFFVGMPDGHVLAYAWVPVAVWLFERLRLLDHLAPRENVVVFGLALGAGLVTYLSTISLLGFVWLYGLGRTPLRRLVAITLLAFAVKAGWHAAGGVAGLEFQRIHGTDDREGALIFLRHVAGLFGSAPAQHARALARILGACVVPAFGWPLLVASAIGLFLARNDDRRLAVAISLPAYVAPIPHCAFWYLSPTWLYPASFGLAILAAIAVAALGNGARRAVQARGGRESHGLAAYALVLAAALGGFALVESSDLLGWPTSAFYMVTDPPP